MEGTLVEMIGSVGFPIVAFLLMYWQARTTIRENTHAINELVLELRRRK